MSVSSQEMDACFDAAGGTRLTICGEETRVAPRCVHQLFESQVLRSPHAVALVFKNRQLTYRELDQSASEVSRALVKHGVKPGMFVAICAERGIALAAGVLAVLKTGAAYVPLEPSLPDDRLGAMLDDCRPAVLLTERKLLSRISACSLPAVCIDENDDPSILHGAGPAAAASRSADALAYLIYTSGTTGKPKGVLIEQRSLVNHCQATVRLYQLGPADRVLQFTSFGFDVAAEELFPAWASGATVVMWPAASGLAPIRNFVDFVDRARISVLNLPAPYWHEWVAELDQVGVPSSVRLVIVGSDVVLAAKAAAWQKHTRGRVRLVNAYGPTETTITATTFEVPAAPAPRGSVPIGSAIANVTTYVLDENLRPLECGGVGELYIGGAGVARGYLDRNEPAAKNFCADPFDAAVGAQLYRTGDQVRRLPDGNLEFLGRIDDQVKIRGVRVETAEIEALLRRHGKVHRAAVIAREDDQGTRQLTAYVVGRDGGPPSARQLRKFLQAQMPDYMVPRFFVSMRRLPFTAGGKLDRRRLPAPPSPRSALDNEYVAPRNAIETVLAEIWEGVLHVRPIGIKDDFFDLAGDSLLLVRVAAVLERRLKVNLALTALFQARTVEALARVVASRRQARAGALICPYRVHGARPPLFCHGGSDDLARLLGTDQPVYWLDPHGMNGAAIPATIESMAAEYLDEMQAIQPRGPYCLLGYSFGALVMLELARLLLTRGEIVDLLVLIDPSAPPDLEAKTRQSLLAPEIAGGRAQSLGVHAASWRLGMVRWRRATAEWLCRSAAALGVRVPASLRLIHFAQGSDRALRRYRSKVYPGSFTLFRRPDNLTESQWRDLALTAIEVHDSWIDHNEFLERPYVQQICRHIEQHMLGRGAGQAPHRTFCSVS